jgi:hypothetical protein
MLKTMLKTKLNNEQAMKYGLMNYGTLEDNNSAIKTS